MRLFGGAQYHRAMAEFRNGIGQLTCPDISREEIVNACGIDDFHDGVNYTRTACVIAVSKARDVFEPFLHQVRCLCCAKLCLGCHVAAAAVCLCFISSAVCMLSFSCSLSVPYSFCILCLLYFFCDLSLMYFLCSLSMLYPICSLFVLHCLCSLSAVESYIHMLGVHTQHKQWVNPAGAVKVQERSAESNPQRDDRLTKLLLPCLQLGYRFAHVLRRMLPIAMYLLQRDSQFLNGHDLFLKRVGASYHAFIEEAEKVCRGKCQEDLQSTTRYVTWSLHTKSRSSLKAMLSKVRDKDHCSNSFIWTLPVTLSRCRDEHTVSCFQGLVSRPCCSRCVWSLHRSL